MSDVPVTATNLRKFCRLVREYELYNNISTSFVTLNEVPGKGHWFRGVMDDGTLQPFLASALALTTKPKLPSSFSIFTINPATTGSRGGLRILQLHTPFESSRIGVTMSEKWPSDWHLKTRNVHRFRFRAINGVHPRPNKIYVDDNAYALTIPRGLTAHNGTSPNYADFCRISAGIVMPGELKWKLCNDRVFPLSASLTRGPDTSGPLTQVISGLRVSVIYPAAHKELLGLAVRYANALHSIGLAASVKPDSTASQLVEQGIDNFVLLGGSGVNAVSTELQRRELSAEVRTDIGMICVGGRCTRRPGAGIAFLAPGRFRRLVVVIAGTDMTGLDAAAAFLPLSPEQKTPEWVLVQAGDGFGWRGYGAVEAAGYWDSEWRIDPRRTYPADWALPRIPRQRGVRWSRKFMLVFAMIAVAVAIARLTMGMPPEESKTSCNNVDESKAFFMVEDAANGTTSTCSAAQLGDSS